MPALRRNPFGAQALFGYDQEYEPKPAGQFLGFSDVAGVGVPSVPGVGSTEVIPPEQQQAELIAPVDAAQVGANEGGGANSGGQVAAGGDVVTDAMIEQRRRLAKALMGNQQEVHHPLQAIGNAVSQITGAWMEGKAARDEAKRETSRRDQLKAALGQGGDVNALADRLLKSTDPDLVDKGLELKMKAFKASQDGGDAPTTRNFYEGDRVVTKQWDAKSRTWQTIGDGAPRWKARGGGGGGNDDADAIGGEPGRPSSGPFSDDVATMMADRVLKYGDPSIMSNLSRANGGAQGSQILERIVTRGKELGLSPDEIAQRYALAKADYSALQRGLGESSRRGSQLLMATHAARGMAAIARQQSRKVNRGQFMPWNRIQLAIQGQTGDPNVKAFYASVNSFVNAYARAVTPVGAPTDSKMKHAFDMLNTAQSQEQFDAVMDVLDQEMEAELKAVGETQSDFRDDYMDRRQIGEREAAGGGGSSRQPPAEQPAQPKGYKKGDVVRGFRMIRDGDWRDKNNWERVK